MHKTAIEVLIKALEKIQFEENWNKNSQFGEDCDSMTNVFTLGCALETAQLEVKGKKENRSKEMGVVRKLIYFNYLWRAGIHPITYFNSNRRTKHADVIGILQKAIKKLQ